MYNIDLKNIIPIEDLTCLFAKATKDESKLWHRRLGHLNFKTVNKLVKGNLVRGTKDETSSTLKSFRVENLMNLRVKVIRCDDGTEFKNKEINQFCEVKGKFDGKADKGFFVGYSLNSKAFIVFNSKTRIMEENLHVSSLDNEFQPLNDDAKRVDEDLSKENECNDQGEEDITNNTNRVNTVTLNVNTASFSGVNNVGTNISIDLSTDPNMPSLEDIGIFEDSYDDEDVFGAEADFHNLDSTFQVSPILTTRIILLNKSLEICIQHLRQGECQRIWRNMVWLHSLSDGCKECILDGKIEEVVFVCQPPRFDDPDFPDKVYKVEKALYGLHQALRAWPDIMFVVCACARYQVTPKVSHLHVVKRIFRYLKGQPKLGLWYPKDSPFDLVAYTDSDYARESLDRKSTTKECQFLGCRLISWQCKKQTVVANSITKADVENERFALLVFKCWFFTTPQMVINSPCLTNKKELAIPGQTTTGKELSNPLMAGNFPKTTLPTKLTIVKFKTINDDVWLQSLINGKRVVITEASIRHDLKLNDAEGTSCLSNAVIFGELARMGAKTTSWNEFSSTMASAIICLANNQKFNFLKYILDNLKKNLEAGVPFYMFPRIEQYFEVQDHALWDVIEIGNSFVLLTQTKTTEGGAITTTISSPGTAEEKIKKKNNVKARSMLLMEVLNEHLMTFNQYKDAKSLFAAIKTRFDGNEAIKKTHKTLLKQMYKNFSALSTESLDSIFNRL
nr:putative ribonuclease H-like domain-containing protein [Tanacetum cinerariifolium]